MRRPFLLAAIAIALIVAPQSASAQRQWLEAGFTRAGRLTVFLMRGEPGKGSRMQQERTGLSRFELLDISSQKPADMLSLLRENGMPLIEQAQRDLPKGTSLLLLDTTSYLDKLTSSQLQPYLYNEPPETHGQLDAKVDQKAQQRGLVMMVRRSHRCMTLVQNGPTRTDPLPADPVDDELTFVLMSPTNTLTAEANPIFQVQFHRQPMPGQGVWVWQWDDKRVLTKRFMRSDDKGQIHVTLENTNKVLLSVTRARWAFETLVDWRIQETALFLTLR